MVGFVGLWVLPASTRASPIQAQKSAFLKAQSVKFKNASAVELATRALAHVGRQTAKTAATTLAESESNRTDGVTETHVSSRAPSSMLTSFTAFHAFLPSYSADGVTETHVSSRVPSSKLTSFATFHAFLAHTLKSFPKLVGWFAAKLTVRSTPREQEFPAMTVCSSPRPDLAAANQHVFGGHTGSDWCLRGVKNLVRGLGTWKACIQLRNSLKHSSLGWEGESFVEHLAEGGGGSGLSQKSGCHLKRSPLTHTESALSPDAGHAASHQSLPIETSSGFRHDCMPSGVRAMNALHEFSRGGITAGFRDPLEILDPADTHAWPHPRMSLWVAHSKEAAELYVRAQTSPALLHEARRLIAYSDGSLIPELGVGAAVVVPGSDTGRPLRSAPASISSPTTSRP
ncbi:hypothetical protein CROQUDRAFT_85591 [Cronartium quercuum f. sp. fusiforme G11]|uniref:Uncharacterized protein n=1 Tax=Cronartium quercuum f. sp. fusiforme G11 TaxID=708437 RepID=A0A9P6NZT0_9BASI|nr:hypothetical protein CROQUDRAFT_85591 [Cronartium quercuum f. sp. fusiforme G11]